MEFLPFFPFLKDYSVHSGQTHTMVYPLTTTIHTLLSPAVVRVGLPDIDKEAALKHMVTLLAHNPAVHDLDRVQKAVLQRESKMSTGVGKGIALPHARTQAVDQPLVAFAVTAQPIDFSAFDNQPVRLIFLLVTPADTTAQHIKLLSRISLLLHRDEFRTQLCSALDDQAIIDLFEQEEKRLFEQ
jgi:PTS system fructose-specific IIA component